MTTATRSRKATTHKATKPAVEEKPAAAGDIDVALAAPTQAELVAHVRAHAEKYHGNGRGWDLIVETWSDEEIASHLGRVRTFAGAERAMYPFIGAYAEAQRVAAIEAGREPAPIIRGYDVA